MIRGFEILDGYSGINLPTRQTALSAGYDLEAAENILVSDKKISLVPTGLEAFFSCRGLQNKFHFGEADKNDSRL